MMECPFCPQDMMWIFWILLIILLGAGVYWIVSRLSGGNSAGPTNPDGPLDTLKRRYAEGELSDEEFEHRRRKLEEKE